MGRQAVRRSEVAGHPIARGTIIIVPTWVVHGDPRWFEEPEAFRPERWADELVRPRYAYFPFGGGPRQCVGNAFAMFAMKEAVVVLATVARRFRLELEPGQRVTATPVHHAAPGARHSDAPRFGANPVVVGPGASPGTLVAPPFAVRIGRA